MKKLIIVAGSLVILGVLVFMSGCSATPSASGPTYGSQSQAGQVVFANECSGCHGVNGQGNNAPAVIGANAALGKYNTAKGLLDFISTSMPLNAPASLTHQDYINVLSYLLVQNNYALPATAFSESALTDLQLK